VTSTPRTEAIRRRLRGGSARTTSFGRVVLTALLDAGVLALFAFIIFGTERLNGRAPKPDQKPLRTGPLVPRQVVLQGRRHQAIRAAVWFMSYVSAVAFMLGWTILKTGSLNNVPGVAAAGVLIVVVALALGIVLMIRRKGAIAAQLAEQEPADALGGSDPADKKMPLSGTTVVCSGGGIKSATFSLGALQRLNDTGILTPDVNLVAVSGGGYMAAAWVTAAYRRLKVADNGGRENPLADVPGPVNILRGRTNYLFTAGRARFDLVASVVMGLLLNGVLLAGPLVAFSWMVGGFALGAGIVTIDPATHALVREQLQFVTALIPAGLLVLAAAAIFMRERLWGKAPIGGRLISWVAGVKNSSTDVAAAASSTPNRMIGAAFAYLILVPGLLWFTAHQFPKLDPGELGKFITDNATQIVSVIAALSALAGLGHSGAKNVKAPQSNLGLAWLLVRRTLAPTAALALVAGLAYLGCAALVAHEIRDPLQDGAAWAVAAVAIGGPLLVWAIGSANLVSGFPYYRDRLRYAYLDSTAGVGGRRQVSETTDAVTLADVTGKNRSGPLLRLVCTANADSSARLPTGRNGTPFIMSDQVGFPHDFGPYGECTVGVAPYEYDQRKSLTVADAMAISGAAIAPRAGRQSRMLGSWRILLALANIRLGVWARNPYYWDCRPQKGTRKGFFARANSFIDRPSGLQVLVEALGALRIDQPYLYLTDGGHFDNPGLVVALGLHPETIYLIDGTGDDENGFAGIGDAIATARMDLGVEVKFDPKPMMRPEVGYPSQGWQVATATCPSWTGTCTIIYIKAVLPDDLSWDLYAYQKRNPDFPAALQRFESFDEFDFEAYRQLGWEITNAALVARQPERPRWWCVKRSPHDPAG
jgi:hypothetical protein